MSRINFSDMAGIKRQITVSLPSANDYVIINTQAIDKQRYPDGMAIPVAAFDEYVDLLIQTRNIIRGEK